MPRKTLRRVLPAFLIFYGIASLMHFAHNAELLAEYPNLPDSLTRTRIYAVWSCITAMGILGYVLTRRSHRLIGLGVLAAYAGFGFDGLLHYSRAPMASHTMGMNVTIWLEVLAATLVLSAVVASATRPASVIPLTDRAT